MGKAKQIDHQLVAILLWHSFDYSLLFPNYSAAGFAARHWDKTTALIFHLDHGNIGVNITAFGSKLTLF